MPFRASTDDRSQCDPLLHYDKSRPEELWRRSVEVNRARYTAMVCCAFCGVVRQGASLCWQKTKVPPDGDLPPYGLANPAFLPYIQPDSSNWWACNFCKKPKDRQRRVSLLPCWGESYLSTLFSCHPLQVMLLCLLDISTNFADRYRSFLKGGMQSFSMLPCTFLSWNQMSMQELLGRDLPIKVQDLFTTNMAYNPLYRKFLCLAELPDHGMHLPVLTQEAVKTITGSHQARTPLPDSDADFISEQLGIVNCQQIMCPVCLSHLWQAN